MPPPHDLLFLAKKRGGDYGATRELECDFPIVTVFTHFTRIREDYRENLAYKKFEGLIARQPTFSKMGLNVGRSNIISTEYHLNTYMQDIGSFRFAIPVLELTSFFGGTYCGK